MLKIFCTKGNYREIVLYDCKRMTGMLITVSNKAKDRIIMPAHIYTVWSFIGQFPKRQT